MPPKRKQRAEDRREDADEGSSDTQEPPSKRVAMLKPRVRKIAEETIKNKWTTLPESVQDRIHELFRAVELPAITRNRDERKRIEAQSALAAVKKNLGKRLPRMPFPPGTKDVSFDYEAALHENRALESQITMTTNSTRLLQADIRREEAELAKEKSKLEELERNAKAAKSERKRQSKNTHPVLRRLELTQEQPESNGTDFDVANLLKFEEGGLVGLAADPSLRPLVIQLRNHLESMQNNVRQVAGIKEAITRAQSSLNLLPLG